MLEIFFEVLVWYGTPHLWYGIIVVWCKCLPRYRTKSRVNSRYHFVFLGYKSLDYTLKNPKLPVATPDTL